MLTGMYSGKASSQGTLHIVYHVAKYQCVNEMMEFVYIVYVAIQPVPVWLCNLMHPYMLECDI